MVNPVPQSNHYHHLMFGPAAIARQKVDGSYTAYGSQTERPDDGPTPLDTREKAMIRALDQFQIATVAETGWPYIQYRSGPKGFLQVLDDRTVGFADFAGNHQYVTAANLDHDDRVALLLVNYPLRQRLKLYGRARTVEKADDPSCWTD
jgi:predicted pyridoxine 5'-phosphate oxidase superfamily flavin-nucleotide-binding protein